MRSKIQLAMTILVIVVCRSAVAQPSRSAAGSSAVTPDGVLHPWREADAATAESGLVRKLLVKVGDVVAEGQPIAELDCATIRLQLQSAREQVAAQGHMMIAQAEVAFSRRKVESLEAMLRKSQANELEIERARVDLSMAEGRLQNELDDKRVLKLQVERLEEQLRDRVVKAPFSGVIVKMHKEVGEYVAANTPQIARVADVSKMKATFYLADYEVRNLRKNKKMLIKVSSGQVFEASFDYLLPYANDESGLIEMQMVIDNVGGEVLGSRCQLLLDGPSA